MNGKSRRRPVWSLSLVLLVFVLTLVPRGADLISDPPPDLGESGGYYADEGFWTHNARNKILFGEPVLDTWNNMFASPLTHWPQYFAFRFLGVGLPQARVVSVLLSLFSVLLIARGLSGSTSIAAAVLFACNVLLIHFGRLALLETPVNFLLLLSWFLLAGKNPGKLKLSLSGLVMGLAVATKLSVIYFVPSVLATVLILPVGNSRLKDAGFVCLGFVLAMALWLVVLGPDISSFLAYTSYYSSQQSPWISKFLGNVANPVLFSRYAACPVLLVAGLVVSMGVMGKIRTGTVPRSIVMATFWFATGALYLNTLTYNPLRYHIPLIPPMIILVSWAAVEAWNGRLKLTPGLPGILFCLVFLWPILWSVVVNLRPGLMGWGLERKVLLFLVWCFGLYLGWRILAVWIRPLTVSRSLVGVLLASSLVFQTVQYVEWLSTKRTDVYDTGKELGRILDRAVLTGQWSPVLCLGNQHRAVPVWPGFINDNEPFEKHGITHGVIWGRHWEKFNSWYPKEFSTAVIIDTLWIKGTPVILCEFQERRPTEAVP